MVVLTLFSLRADCKPSLWNELIRLWEVLVQVADHIMLEHNLCLKVHIPEISWLWFLKKEFLIMERCKINFHS
jgi:hypothetical protein